MRSVRPDARAHAVRPPARPFSQYPDPLQPTQPTQRHPHPPLRLRRRAAPRQRGPGPRALWGRGGPVLGGAHGKCMWVGGWVGGPNYTPVCIGRWHTCTNGPRHAHHDLYTNTRAKPTSQPTDHDHPHTPQHTTSGRRRLRGRHARLLPCRQGQGLGGPAARAQQRDALPPRVVCLQHHPGHGRLPDLRGTRPR